MKTICILLLGLMVWGNIALFDSFTFRRIFENLKSNELKDIATCYSIDGLRNNVKNPEWGAAGFLFERVLPNSYSDNLGEIPQRCRNNQRIISNILSKSPFNIKANRSTSDMLWAFGQFLAHDFALSADGKESSNILIPSNDDIKDQKEIVFNRLPAALDPKYTQGRQFKNMITNYLDLSSVYGSEPKRARALRTLYEGKLKTTKTKNLGDFLPNNFNTSGSYLANSAPSTTPEDFFVAGDLRVNGFPGLIALHTLFVREHNRLADEIIKAARSLNFNLQDQVIYDIARACNIMQYQRIVYNDFLPAVIGQYAPRYRDIKYNENADFTIPIEYSTTALRFGHFIISDYILLANKDRSIMQRLFLNTSFFNTSSIRHYGIDPILRGLTYQAHQEMDLFASSSIRDHLFLKLRDLIAIDIKRACDVGAPSYAQIYRYLFKTDIQKFSDITPIKSLQLKLAQVYSSVNNIDPIIGMFAEKALDGSLLGRTATKILFDTFYSWVEGDRCFYTHLLNKHYPLFVRAIDPMKLSDVIYANTLISPNDMGENCFYTKYFRY